MTNRGTRSRGEPGGGGLISLLPRPATHPARSRGLSAKGKLRTSLWGSRPQLARVATAFLLSAVAPGLFFDAHAQGRCGPRADMTQQLADRFGEEVVSLGVVGNGLQVVETWASRETGTWTIVVTTAQGRVSCIISAGQDWQGEFPRKDEDL